MRNIKLIASFLAYAFKRELEFRFNLTFFFVFHLIWIATSVIGVILIFNQAGTIAGWNRNQAILLILIYYLTSTFIKAFVIPGASSLSELVRKGDLDFVLTKPVDNQLFISLQRIYLNQFFRFTIILIIVPFYLRSINITINTSTLMLASLTALTGIIGLHGIFTIIACLSFWLENIWNLNDFFHDILDVSKRPVDIFRGITQQIAIFVIPVGLIASIPTKVLLRQIHWNFALYSIFTSLALFFLSRFFFKFALRHYSSASS